MNQNCSTNLSSFLAYDFLWFRLFDDIFIFFQDLLFPEIIFIQLTILSLQYHLINLEKRQFPQWIFNLYKGLLWLEIPTQLDFTLIVDFDWMKRMGHHLNLNNDFQSLVYLAVLVVCDVMNFQICANQNFYFLYLILLFPILTGKILILSVFHLLFYYLQFRYMYVPMSWSIEDLVLGNLLTFYFNTSNYYESLIFHC